MIPKEERIVTIQSVLTENVRTVLDGPRNWYRWKINPELLPPGIQLEGTESYDRNLELKYKLSEALKTGDWNGRLELVDYYIRTWGGIKNNNPETLWFYAHSDPIDLIARGTQGVASWSKALCIRNPDRYAIFDARVSAALNALQMIGKTEHPLLFPTLTSQNTTIAASKAFLKNTADKYGWQKAGDKEFYLIYLDLLKSLSHELKESIQTIEMVLFSKAEELLRQAMEKDSEATKKDRTSGRILRTFGGPKKSLEFSYCQDDTSLRIENEKNRMIVYSLQELDQITLRLKDQFAGRFFPLGNNVEKLGNGTEVEGFGTIVHEITGNITKAQGVSYLGPILTAEGILEWNGKNRGIEFRIKRNK